MQTLDLEVLNRSPKNYGIQIEPAYDCDGSECHQPIFREDGTLNHIPPHSHMIERDSTGERCYAVFCDFPTEKVSTPKQRSACY